MRISIDYIFPSKDFKGWLYIKGDMLRVKDISSVRILEDNHKGNIEISLIGGQQFEYRVELGAQSYLIHKHIMELINNSTLDK